MIYLDQVDRKLQASVAVSAVSAYPQATVCFYDVPASSKPTFEDYRGATKFSTLAGANLDTDICSAPPIAGTTRNIKYASIFNKQQVASATVTVIIDYSSGESFLVTQVLAPLETLVYEDGSGWQIV